MHAYPINPNGVSEFLWKWWYLQTFGGERRCSSPWSRSMEDLQWGKLLTPGSTFAFLETQMKWFESKKSVGPTNDMQVVSSRKTHQGS